MFQLFMMIGTALIVVEIIMFLFWIIYLIRQKVDVIATSWGIGFIAAILVDFLLGAGFIWRKILILSLVSIWALHLVWQVVEHLLPRQSRYPHQLFLSRWPYASYPNLQLLSFLGFQGAVITLLSIPFALINQDTLPFFNTFEVFGLLVWMSGIQGIAMAYRQFNRNIDSSFAKNKRIGKYIVYTAYFFEWLLWLGYSVMAFSAPFGWVGLGAPLLIIYLLFKNFGEIQTIQTQNEDHLPFYTHMNLFFPWLNKKSHSAFQSNLDLSVKQLPLEDVQSENK